MLVLANGAIHVSFAQTRIIVEKLFWSPIKMIAVCSKLLPQDARQLSLQCPWQHKLHPKCCKKLCPQGPVWLWLGLGSSLCSSGNMAEYQVYINSFDFCMFPLKLIEPAQLTTLYKYTWLDLSHFPGLLDPTSWNFIKNFSRCIEGLWIRLTSHIP